ncbi:MAG TPA: di-heme oxidoredictase family protein [Thermoanaerobaculia bacterium]|nr:di-heme oxidoredictase family protein [Thermoanaerobaculia bacterium]
MGSRVSFRIAVSMFLVLALAALTPQPNISPPPDFGQPLAGLSSDLLDRFDAGRSEFQSVETPEEEVGPVFNDVSCANCHNVAAVGGGSAVLETRFGTTAPDGTFDPMTQYGGSLIQSQGIGAAGTCDYVGEIVPPEATITAHRRTTPLFGLGLVDAVPDATFYAIAADEAHNPYGITGTVSVVTNISAGQNAVGKFGWKGQNPTLFQFSGDAYLNEMGVTSPQFPNENCPQGDCASLSCNPDPGLNDDGTSVQEFADFMTYLAPPPRGPINAQVLFGQVVFASIGCAACHRANLTTGPNPVPALNRVTFHPYSDFLLHDMGSLGDGITQNLATGKLMRTAPLWGLRRVTAYLHDGRASTLPEAILAHDGQGKKARNRYAAMPVYEKAWLAAFLNSL